MAQQVSNVKPEREWDLLDASLLASLTDMGFAPHCRKKKQLA